MRRSIFLLALLLLSPALAVQAKPASPACQECKANAVQACQQLVAQQLLKQKKLKGCIEKGKKKCKDICKGKAAPMAPVQAPEGEKLEDHPCFNHCATTCGGGTKEKRDACVLDCLQTTSCRKPVQ